MIKIIAAKNFTANDKSYIEGEEIEGLKFEQILKLNELGFIKSLDFKDLTLLKRELESKKNKEE